VNRNGLHHQADGGGGERRGTVRTQGVGLARPLSRGAWNGSWNGGAGRGTGERKVPAFWVQRQHSRVVSVQVADPKLGSMLLTNPLVQGSTAWRPTIAELRDSMIKAAPAAPLVSQAHPATQPGLHCAVFRRSIVPLPASASRSLPAVASHAIGFAGPRHGTHSPGSGACWKDGENGEPEPH
jgi:hypothetical protein